LTAIIRAILYEVSHHATLVEPVDIARLRALLGDPPMVCYTGSGPIPFFLANPTLATGLRHFPLVATGVDPDHLPLIIAGFAGAIPATGSLAALQPIVAGPVLATGLVIATNRIEKGIAAAAKKEGEHRDEPAAHFTSSRPSQTPGSPLPA
jgi:hypothetical protein